MVVVEGKRASRDDLVKMLIHDIVPVACETTRKAGALHRREFVCRQIEGKLSGSIWFCCLGGIVARIINSIIVFSFFICGSVISLKYGRTKVADTMFTVPGLMQQLSLPNLPLPVEDDSCQLPPASASFLQL